MQSTTYLYEVTFKVDDSFDFERVRAANKIEAAKMAVKLREKFNQCVSIISVSLYGN